MRVHLDISKLVDEPRRSGIQRVERELIRHWPGPEPLVPCRFDPGAGELRVLPRAIMDELCRDAPPGGLDEERARLAPWLERAGPAVDADHPLLCAELFDDPARARYYVGAPARASLLVYDFLPWLHPEWFPAGPANRLMPFLHALRSVSRLAFISAATRRDCAERLLRRPCDGPVIPLGTDGLGLERQAFDPAKRDVVLLGTIEARKNVAAAIRAFERLWREGADVRLVLIGAVERDALEEQALLRALAREERLVQHGSLPDEGVRASLASARVLLFPSEGEGYGLPPMEALAAGIPVIVSAALPALDGLPGAGQIRLHEADAPSIARAVRSVLDDATARRLWDEAAGFSLPTWRDFARAVADWMGATAPPGPARSSAAPAP